MPNCPSPGALILGQKKFPARYGGPGWEVPGGGPGLGRDEALAFLGEEGIRGISRTWGYCGPGYGGAREIRPRWAE